MPGVVESGGNEAQTKDVQNAYEDNTAELEPAGLDEATLETPESGHANSHEPPVHMDVTGHALDSAPAVGQRESKALDTDASNSLIEPFSAGQTEPLLDGTASPQTVSADHSISRADGILDFLPRADGTPDSGLSLAHEQVSDLLPLPEPDSLPVSATTADGSPSEPPSKSSTADVLDSSSQNPLIPTSSTSLSPSDSGSVQRSPLPSRPLLLPPLEQHRDWDRHQLELPEDDLWVEGPVNDPFDEEVAAPEDFAGPSSLKRPLSSTLMDDDVFGARKRTRTFVTQIPVYVPTDNGMTTQVVYLVNTARKRTLVVDVAEGLTMPEMRAAMDAEIASFRRMDCVEAVAMCEVPKGANLVTTRWVFTIKTKEDGTKRYKARLVARGFEDDEKRNVTRDSPTAATSSQRLVLQVLVENQWLPTSWDFETAFLQGKPIEREVYIAAPEGYAAPGSCWRLKKPVYGLVSAPKAWFDRLREVIQKHGFKADLSDEAIFCLRSKAGAVIGVLAIHVDDTLGGGTSEFHAVMDAVAKDLKVGSKEEENFHYKGLRITTTWHKGEFEVTVDGMEYLDSTVQMPLPANRDDSSLLTPADATNYRSVVGSIGYMSSAFRPDIALETSLLGRVFQTPTVRDARKANAILAWMKSNTFNLRFRKGAVCLTAFSDSAGPHEEATQGGRIFALTSEDGHRVAAWIYWESRKVKRVCRSTATGEILSLHESFDTSMWLQQVWLDLTGKTISIRLVVDSMGALSNVVTTKLPAEKRLRIDLAALRQGLRRGLFVITWVPSRANLSDPLTKEAENEGDRLRPCDRIKRPLLDALRSNCTNLKGVESTTKTQADVSNYCVSLGSCPGPFGNFSHLLTDPGVVCE
jgi:Reverse transcriptase (RNA-dependent DNA polymerase)